MQDVHTGEQLVFPCHRWLSRDEDDGEICRELPAVRPREPILPGLLHCFLYTYNSLIFLRQSLTFLTVVTHDVISLRQLYMYIHIYFYHLLLEFSFSLCFYTHVNVINQILKYFNRAF